MKQNCEQSNAISKNNGGAVRVTVPNTLLTGDDLTENLPTVLQACGYATGHVGKCTVLGNENMHSPKKKKISRLLA